MLQGNIGFLKNVLFGQMWKNILFELENSCIARETVMKR